MNTRCASLIEEEIILGVAQSMDRISCVAGFLNWT